MAGPWPSAELPTGALEKPAMHSRSVSLGLFAARRLGRQEGAEPGFKRGGKEQVHKASSSQTLCV